MLKQFDLCSGVGAGFPFAGLKTGGFTLAKLCEIDDYCRDILTLRYPGVPIAGDIKRHDWGAVGEIDIVTASPPCQPFSIQGKRLAADDPRDCFPHVIKAIAEIQPSYFAIENVKGLLSCPYRPGHKERYFGRILSDFSKCGYDVEWLVVSSGHFGAPFLRERLLMVGKSQRVECSGACAWTEQVRGSTEIRTTSTGRAVHQSSFSRGCFRDSTGLVRPLGVPVRNSAIRREREALGNCLDPRVAKVALARILYLNSLLEK